MRAALRAYLITLSAVWIALLVAASLLAQQTLPHPYLWVAVVPACLLEACFYLASLFEHTRSRFESWRNQPVKLFGLWVTAVAPYLIVAINSHSFSPQRCGLLSFLAAIPVLWFAVLPRRPAYDVGYLLIIAAAVVNKVFNRIYWFPDLHLRLDILGSLMWIRVTLLILLTVRKWHPGPWGLWPQSREWKWGLIWFAVSVLPISGLAILIHDVRFVPPATFMHAAIIFVGTFFGFFWVSGLAEELYFRGIIERALFLTTKNWPIAIVASAVIFGLAHLWYHAFPNWQRAVTASCLGVSCGICYAQTGSTRTSLVAHSMVVAVLKTFFVV